MKKDKLDLLWTCQCVSTTAMVCCCIGKKIGEITFVAVEGLTATNGYDSIIVNLYLLGKCA